MAEADFLSILLSKPKLKALNKYHNLNKEWYFLGAELEVDDEDLNKIEDRYSDDRMRMIKMFGVWLEKGKKPNYKTLIKALVDIDKKGVAQSLCTDLGKHLYLASFPGSLTSVFTSRKGAGGSLVRKIM